MSQASKKVSIVFEETCREAGGMGFTVKLEGFPLKRRNLPENEWGAAEFWAFKMMLVVAHRLEVVGALRSIRPGAGQ